DCQPVIRHSCPAGCETTPKISAKVCMSRAFLELFSRVSRANLERYSSDIRAILETYPTHLRSISGLVSRGIRVYSSARQRQIADSAKSNPAKSYQIVRNFTKPYQSLPNLTKSNKVLPSFTISCEFLPIPATASQRCAQPC